MRRLALLFAVALLSTLGLSPAAAVVPVYGGITGRVTDSTGAGVGNALLNFHATKGGETHYSVFADALGYYSTYDVEPGTYWVYTNIGYLDPVNDVTPQYFEDSFGRIPVVVDAGFVTSGVDIARRSAGALSGKVIYDSSVAPSVAATHPTFVQALRFDPDTGFAIQVGGSRSHLPDGSFSFSGLEPGEYTIRFLDLNAFSLHSSPVVNTEYYGDAEWLDDATTFTVTAGSTITLSDETISAGAQPVSSTERLDGLDRFAAAVSFSEQAIATGDDVPVVYIVNGLNFPDALSAGPAAAFEGGVLLLVEPTLIPMSTRNELLRLAPDRIEIVGGPASVSESVKSQLNAIAPTTRIGGQNRFEASRAVAEKVFEPFGAREAFIVTGYNYPDALSAGSIASIIGAPVILVDSGVPWDAFEPLDAATKQLLIDLGVEQVHIVGGPGSVTTVIERSLINMPSLAVVDRFGGADRYDASANLAASFPQADVRFLATGRNFPDALAGSWLAGRSGGAVILVPGDCIPSDTANLLASVQFVVILGGPGSVTPAVENRTVC
jgi:putative cell wall-binding protein